VTVWTSGQADWAGLTVSSLMLAQGQPSRLVGLINPESDLAEMIEQSERFVVHLLGDRPDHRRLAQHFAGSLEAPAEWLQIEASAHGPRLVVVADQLACRLVSQRPSGWSQLVEAEVEDVQLGDPHLAPRRTGLIWYRGGFRSLPPQA
jgi:flavin reductase (DIM6/NTAB) family NADH-FMN oxidoreductase RutF